MHHSLDRIYSKPTDYILCADKECRSLNWYENDTCLVCDGILDSSTQEEDVKIYVDDIIIDWTDDRFIELSV